MHFSYLGQKLTFLDSFITNFSPKYALQVKSRSILYLLHSKSFGFSFLIFLPLFLQNPAIANESITSGNHERDQ